MTYIEYIEGAERISNLLERDISKTDKERVVFIAGHFPIVYTQSQAIEALDYWGAFTKTSLSLAEGLASLAKGFDKDPKFVFFVDDHSYEAWDHSGSFSRIKTNRRKLYRERSGVNAKLPEGLRSILTVNGNFEEKDIIRQDQGKEGRRDCLYFSEKILRASSKDIQNPCAREYVEFLEDSRYFDKENDYLISFVPNRCEGHICSALDLNIEGLSASHVFMPTGVWPDLALRNSKVGYRKDE